MELGQIMILITAGAERLYPATGRAIYSGVIDTAQPAAANWTCLGDIADHLSAAAIPTLRDSDTGYGHWVWLWAWQPGLPGYTYGRMNDIPRQDSVTVKGFQYWLGTHRGDEWTPNGIAPWYRD